MSEIIRNLAKPIRAYHGSAYDFDRFDSSKIGTGVGSQVYGHGHYFAQSEGSADTYRQSAVALRRSPRDHALEMWRRNAEASGNKQKAVLDALDEVDASREEAAGIPSAESYWDQIANALYELDFRQPLPKRAGRMYEVEIDYPEGALLDWDAPLSAQPEAVKKSFGSGPYHGMLDSPGDGGRLWYNRSKSGTPESAAAEMVDAGIPGVIYRPGGSRAVQPNYVIFPGAADNIRILRKYGLLAPVAAGPAAQQEQQK